MSLVPAYYSSDDEAAPASPSNDVFAVSSIGASKRPRLRNDDVAKVETSAPDVLTEVLTTFHSPFFLNFIALYS